jgi:hypothetical protein
VSSSRSGVSSSSSSSSNNNNKGDVVNGRGNNGGSGSGVSDDRRLNRLACLTQSDAALTGALLLGSVDVAMMEQLLSGGADGVALLLQEHGRDAAQRVLLNTPHPLTVLSDLKAYGSKGSISTHHDAFNYLIALGKTRRTWEGGQWEGVVEGEGAMMAPGVVEGDGASSSSLSKGILIEEILIERRRGR